MATPQTTSSKPDTNFTADDPVLLKLCAVMTERLDAFDIAGFTKNPATLDGWVRSTMTAVVSNFGSYGVQMSETEDDLGLTLNRKAIKAAGYRTTVYAAVVASVVSTSLERVVEYRMPLLLARLLPPSISSVRDDIAKDLASAVEELKRIASIEFLVAEIASSQKEGQLLPAAFGF